MSAGASGTGRQFAAQAADIHFTSIPDLDRAPEIVKSVKNDAAEFGHDTEVYMLTQIVCRPSRTDAEDFYHYYAEEHADHEALDYFRRQRMKNSFQRSNRTRITLHAHTDDPIYPVHRQELFGHVSRYISAGWHSR